MGPAAVDAPMTAPQMPMALFSFSGERLAEQRQPGAAAHALRPGGRDRCVLARGEVGRIAHSAPLSCAPLSCFVFA
jgi:hypothetical protein